MPKPDTADYPSFYSGYVNKVPDVNLYELLSSQGDTTSRLFSGLAEEQANHTYAPGKWSMKQLLGHITDAERIFTYRALCMARGDRQPLPRMDQDLYVDNANFAGRTIDSLVAEYRSVRLSTLHFLDSLTEADLKKTGTANNGHFTVNALMYIIAGHELHHMAIIEERYLKNLPAT